MFHTVLTLICNPATPVLDAHFTSAVSGHLADAGLNVSDHRVLADGMAEDFFFSAKPEHVDELVLSVRQIIGERPIDVAVQPVKDRVKRLLIADMDSTMIEQECIDELADFAGLRTEISDITERAMHGELDFEEALTARVAKLKGLPVNVLAKTFADKITLTPGARTLVQTMNKRGGVTALVSGGFTYFTQRVADATGFQHHRANELLIDDGRLNGTVAQPILGRLAKKAALEEFSARYGVNLTKTIAVGDGANDLSMLETAGLGVAFHAKPAVAAAADVQINHGDLTALLYLQGIAQSEFVTA